MTDYALPTFLKEIPDWLKYKELRFINRYDWIAVVFLGLGCYLLGEWSAFEALSGMNGLSMLTWGFFYPHYIALSRNLFREFPHPHVRKKEI